MWYQVPPKLAEILAGATDMDALDNNALPSSSLREQQEQQGPTSSQDYCCDAFHNPMSIYI
jgi:hypothetical protein